MPVQITLDPDLKSALADFVACHKPRRQSPIVETMLLRHGLVTEQDVADLKGEKLRTVRNARTSGLMPAHFKWGHLVCYAAADIVDCIQSQPITPAAKAGREAAIRNILEG